MKDLLTKFCNAIDQEVEVAVYVGEHRAVAVKGNIVMYNKDSIIVDSGQCLHYISRSKVALITGDKKSDNKKG